MEIEEKRKKLESYMDLADNLKSLQKAYEFKRSLAMKITAAAEGSEKGRSDYHANSAEKKIIDSAAALEAFTKCAEKFSALEREIIQGMESIEDMSVQSIMRRYYLCGYTQEKIADELDVGIETVKKKLQKGLCDIKFSEGENG